MRTTLTARISLILAGGITALLLLEAGLRLFGTDCPDFYRPDRHCGTVLREGSRGWYRKESATYIRISDQGLRDREHSVAREAGTVRIAVLGDSYAEAFQVPEEQAFWSVLETEMNGDRRLEGTRIEVINFGVGGYGTAQELLMLRHRVWSFNPDVVLLGFLTGNDVRNNSKILNQEDRVPYFVHRNGNLVLDEGFLDWYRSRQGWLARAYYRALEHSRLLRVLKAIHYSLGRIQRDREQKELALHAGLGEIGLDEIVYREPSDPDWQEAWSVTEEVLGLMNREVRGAGSLFYVVTLTNGDQVHPDPLRRKRLAEKLGVRDLLYPDRRIKAIGDQEGFTVLNLAQPFQEFAERTGTYLHGFGASRGTGHWNEEGHRTAGRLIARALTEELLNRGLLPRPATANAP
jgi:hypothetical protein